MNRLPDEFLFTLLEKNPIAEIFQQEHIYLYPCEKGFSCSCPFHSENGKSCMIYPETHNFYCPVCQTGGDVITFYMLRNRLSYPEAVQMLADKCQLTIPSQTPEQTLQIQKRRERCYAINRETANFYYQNLLNSSDKRGLAYFRERKLSPQTIRDYGLGYAPDDWHQLYDYLTQKGFSEEELLLANVCRKSEKGYVYDNFRNRVIFPIVDMHQHVIGFGGRVLDDSKPKYLNTSDTPVFDKGRNLFSLQFAGKNAPSVFILAEGYMDVIALYQAGFRNAVATLGTAITPEQARLIAQYAEKVIISYDSDTAGQNATQKAIQHFHDVGLPVNILQIDQEAKDPDEYLKKFGAEHFQLLLNQAVSTVEFQLKRCQDGLDLQSETGKVAYLRRCTKILANLQHPKEQKFYIQKLALKFAIRPQVLQNQVDSLQKRQKNSQSKTNFQNHVISSLRKLRAAADKLQQSHAAFCRSSGLPESEQISL
ncbi:MAG: DNA primase, partial [Oscillospiraceae bacterium]|nr:DNA primase [Oscillospiraceae bacterium]